MVRRRTLLRRGLATASVVGLGTLAGCQEDLPGDEDEGDGEDGEDGTGTPTEEPSGPAWASWLYDPTTVGTVDAHGFAKYEVSELLSYRDQLPPDLDEGLSNAFSELDGLDSEDVDRVVGQGYLQVPEDPDAEGSQPFGWNVVATGSFDVDAAVARLSEAETYSAAGEYGGFSLFEGPPDDPEFSAAVAVSSDAVIGGGAFRYDVSATGSVERAIDADAGDVDRYYAESDAAATLMERHGDGTTAAGAADPEGSFQPFVEENPSSQAYEALLTSARAAGRSARVGEETTETLLSVELSEPDPEAVEDLQTAVDRAQAERGDPDGPFSDPSVSAEGTTLLVEASAETSRAMGTPSGLAVVAPEAAIAGTFVLNIGGPEREPVPQVAFEFELRDDGRMQIVHTGGDRVERLVVQYRTESGGSSQEAWTDPDGITAGDSYVTEAVPEPGSDILLIWEGDGQSAVVGEGSVPA